MIAPTILRVGDEAWLVLRADCRRHDPKNGTNRGVWLAFSLLVEDGEPEACPECQGTLGVESYDADPEAPRVSPCPSPSCIHGWERLDTIWSPHQRPQNDKRKPAPPIRMTRDRALEIADETMYAVLDEAEYFCKERPDGHPYSKAFSDSEIALARHILQSMRTP